MFTRLRAQARNLIKEAIHIAWSMRGGIQYHDVWEMTPNERDVARDYVKEHLEQVKDHPFPIY